MKKINLFSSCVKLNVPLWQCPQFLFLVMGMVIIGAILSTYFIASLKIGDPTTVVLMVFVVAVVLLIIDFVITNSFERMAEVSKMKTDFINIISHQLRAPLTNLNYSLDFLFSNRQKLSLDQESGYYTILRENSKRMGDLINNLLIVSRLDGNRFPLKKEKISLKKTTENLLEKFQPYIKASNIKVSLTCSENLPLVIGDDLWVEQVIENLLDNAIRYSKGGAEIKMKIENKGDYNYFSIEDSGQGINQEDKKHIFEKFFRSQEAIRGQSIGSGLGLFICKKVVESLGGKIGFESRIGKGTKFFFLLPNAI